jgi:hypothetical protein
VSGGQCINSHPLVYLSIAGEYESGNEERWPLVDTANMIKATAVSGLAALFAYGLNRLMVARAGDRAVKLLIPLVEEGLKTGLALAFSVSVVTVHVGFGTYEAIYDIVANQGVGKGKRWFAALLACLGHGLFGWLTLFLLELRLSSILAIVLVSAVHGCWNILALAKPSL